MRKHPHLFEVNAYILLRRLSEKYGRELTLATIPDEVWQNLAQKGFDLVWLMGVWQRSPSARQVALLTPELRREYDAALPGWSDEDVVGSPYAIYGYELDATLGKPEELVEIKARLNRQGLGLILDFVPNHVALDHPWVSSHPSWFVQAKEEDVRQHPDWFFTLDGSAFLAHGRDPYFPPWTDTAQLNFYSADMREALTDELWRVADISDGVRCDMAMLVVNNVFEEVWGQLLTDSPKPKGEFWERAIGLVKSRKPGFLFLAEVYWGLDKALQHAGFDFTYDKTLYDRLKSSGPAEVRSHLTATEHFPNRHAHFIENHDELRAVVAFGREQSRAAAVVMATAPGLRMFHDGQLEGKKVRLPMQLKREPEETLDSGLTQFYERLLSATNAPAFHEGDWQDIEVGEAWQGNESYGNLMAWSWKQGDDYKIVAVNYSPDSSQGRLMLSLPSSISTQVILRDELMDVTYIRDSNEIRNRGLYVALDPWGSHLFNLLPSIK